MTCVDSLTVTASLVLSQRRAPLAWVLYDVAYSIFSFLLAARFFRMGSLMIFIDPIGMSASRKRALSSP
jgi:hypothetical protein